MKTALMILQILLSLGLIAVVIAQSGHAAGISGANNRWSGSGFWQKQRNGSKIGQNYEAISRGFFGIGVGFSFIGIKRSKIKIGGI